MGRVRLWAGPIALVLTLLFVSSGLLLADSWAAPAAEPTPTLTPTSSTPPPTYISELAPAVMVSPEQPKELPPGGAPLPAASVWPKAAAGGLALLGALAVYAALRLRSQGVR